MDLLTTLAHLRPGDSIGFKEGCEETLSNVVWISQNTYISNNTDLELIWNEEAGVYTEAPFTIPTQQECDDYWNNTLKNQLALDTLRRRRNKRLAACDWTQVNDVVLSNDREWKIYRQALRDITQTTEDPANPVWPAQPSP